MAIKLSDEQKANLVKLAEKHPLEFAQVLMIDPDEADCLSDEIGEARAEIDIGIADAGQYELAEFADMAEDLGRQIGELGRIERHEKTGR